ncbi:MAG: hypothetical protein Q9209_001650 [Squamulea sp. 1 TL-2023]
MLSFLKWVSSVIWRGNGVTRTRLLPPTQSLKEEPIELYCPGRYHPVKLGDILNYRYRVERKLGWGLYSTVWLAKDMRVAKYVALKLLVADAFGFYDNKKQWQPQPRTFENEILKHVNSVQSDHPGRKHIPKLLEQFEHTGPHGTHVCFVFHVMGRSLDSFCGQWSPPRIPSPIMRQVVRQLLSVLDFLHRICGIIHTDIKPSNVLLDLSSPYPEIQEVDWIKFYFDSVSIPTGIAYPNFDHVRTTPIFMPVTDASMIDIRLADFGSACWEEKRLSEVIQPELLRAPEVIFRLPWSSGVDIWSAGIIIYELIAAKHLFDGRTLNNHLKEMEALLERFPQSFINRVPRSEQYFTSDGLVKDADEYEDLTLEDTLSETLLSQEEKRDFLSFLRSMLKISPDERATAQQLLEHPWLHKHYDYPDLARALTSHPGQFVTPPRVALPPSTYEYQGTIMSNTNASVEDKAGEPIKEGDEVWTKIRGGKHEGTVSI